MTLGPKYEVPCPVCGDVARFDDEGKLVLPCACCRVCDGTGETEGKNCYPCAGTGRRLAGSEEITKVERKGPKRATPPPVVIPGRTRGKR